MKVDLDGFWENGFDEIDHFHPNFDKSVPNPGGQVSSSRISRCVRVSESSNFALMLVPVATIWLEAQMVPIGYPQKKHLVKTEAPVNLKQFDVFQCIAGPTIANLQNF